MVGAADSSSSNVGGFVNIVTEKGAGVVTIVGWFVNIRMDDGAIVGADVMDAKVGGNVVGSLVASIKLTVGTDVVGATVVGT